MQSTGTFHFGSTGNETLEGDSSGNLKEFLSKYGVSLRYSEFDVS